MKDNTFITIPYNNILRGTTLSRIVDHLKNNN